MRSDRERLLDILEAVERIEQYAADGRDAFRTNPLIQTWMVHHLQIIGEAARAVSSAFQGEHPEIPWSKIIGMRNILVHHYFGIDEEAVWNVIVNDLPPLKAAVQQAVSGT